MKRLMTVMSVIMMVVIAVTYALAATVTVSNRSTDTATGYWTSDGAAQNVSIGFTPSHITVTNVTGTNLVKAEWMTGMAAASCLKTAGTTTTVGSNDAMVISVPTTSCISAYAGTSSAAPGFTLGADTDINISGDTIRFRAHR